MSMSTPTVLGHAVRSAAEPVRRTANAAVFLLLLSAAVSAAQSASGVAAARSPQVQTRQARPARASAEVRRERRIGTGRIRGTITAQGGKPLRRAEVALFSSELSERRLTMTDAKGSYEFSGLPSARYTLAASKPSYVTLRFGARRPLHPGKPIALSERQDLKQVDLSLPRGSVIAGQVFDEFGEPVLDASVQVMRHRRIQGVPRLGGVGQSRQSDDLGQYRIFGLPPGSYYISAVVRSTKGLEAESESEESTSYAPTYHPNTANLAQAQRVTVALGQELAGVDLTLVTARSSRVSGTAFDSQGRPLGNAAVTLVRREEPFGFVPAFDARVRPNGTFTFANVVPGTYRLQARARVADSSAGPEFGSTPIAVNGQEITGVNLVTRREGTASGEVVFEGASRPSFRPDSVTISARPAGFDLGPGLRSSVAFRLSKDWTFKLTGLFGARVIRVSGIPEPWTLKAVFINGRDVADNGFEFQGAEQVSGVRVVLTDRTTEVNGTMSDDLSEPVTQYTVVVFADDSSRWGPQTRFVRIRRPDRAGRFRIKGLPPGTYRAVALEELEQGEWDPELLEQVRSSATKFTLAEGETRTVRLKLSILP